MDSDCLFQFHNRHCRRLQRGARICSEIVSGTEYCVECRLVRKNKATYTGHSKKKRAVLTTESEICALSIHAVLRNLNYGLIVNWTCESES